MAKNLKKPYIYLNFFLKALRTPAIDAQIVFAVGVGNKPSETNLNYISELNIIFAMVTLFIIGKFLSRHL
jgi:predicted Abi (CAAX) family protease